MELLEYDVILCTYHGDEYISLQLESIMNQGILPNRLIISDDSLDDSLLEIIRAVSIQYQEQSTEWIIVKGPQKGVVRNFFSALRYSKSELLFFCDQDDVWHKGKAKFFLDRYRNVDKNEPILIYSDAEVIDRNGKQLFNSFVATQRINTKVVDDDSILLENCVQGASSCINSQLRNLVKKTLDVIEEDKIIMHDWYFAILAKYFGSVIYLDAPLIGYRQHGTNQVGYVSTFRKMINVLTSPYSTYSKLNAIITQKKMVLEYLALVKKDFLRGTSLKLSQVKTYKLIIFRIFELFSF